MKTSSGIDFVRSCTSIRFAGAVAILFLSCHPESDPPSSPPTSVASLPASDRPFGRYERARTSPAKTLSAKQQAEARGLEAIGYAAGLEEGREGTGITICAESIDRTGLNFFTSGHQPVALLIDMSGEIVHRWDCEVADVWPEKAELASRRNGRDNYFRRARLDENGDVFALFARIGLVKLDFESNVVWHHTGSTHHDLDLAPDGRVFVLEREAYIVPWINEDRPILDDYIVVLDPEGRELDRLSLLDCMMSSPLAEEFREIIQGYYSERVEEEARLRRENAEYFAERPEEAANFDLAGDIFHTNTLQYLDGSQAHLSPHFAEGNLLLSLCHPGLLVILDPRTREAVWKLSGRWRLQHEPSLLSEGRILLFDNRGPEERGEKHLSEILELDALSGEILWSYRAPKRGAFYSMIAGSCQRLENGHTLITESTRGRAFEVTREGEIVWEFQSPFRAGPEREFVAFIPDLQRLPAGFGRDWLKR